MGMNNRFVALLVGLCVGGFSLTATAASGDHASHCGQVFDAAATRVRSTLAGKNTTDPGHKEDSCRAYRDHFFEAVQARQAASLCEDGTDHQQDLEKLDAGVDAVNDLIATHCDGP